MLTKTDDAVRDQPVTTPPPKQRKWFTAGWMAHWLLRMWLALALLVYGWSKVFLLQMPVVDYGQALTMFGEMSPMGLLWRFMGFSPVVQVLAGLAEVLAGVLLLFRRTAWLGGLLGAACMAVVFLLNMTFDVPVKQLALAMGIVGVIVAVPFARYFARVLRGRSTAAVKTPNAVPWPKVARVTRWTAPLAAVLVVVTSFAVTSAATGGGVLAMGGPPTVDAPLPGVYQVVEDSQPPADQLADDTRWQQVAFGQYGDESGSAVAIRYADGRYQEGGYQIQGDTIEVSLYPPREGDQTLIRDIDETFELTWEARPDSQIALTGTDVDLVLEADPEFTYLYDREFRWGPETPVNR